MERSAVSTLPVIVGFGGVNAAGRSSFHHAFLRIMYDAVGPTEQDTVLRSLGRLMGLPSELPRSELEAEVLAHTLIRTIEPHTFDTDRIYRHQRVEARPGTEPIRWRMRRRDLPSELPPHWLVAELGGDELAVSIDAETTLLVPHYERSTVRAAAALPTGFHPGAKYPSKAHPRGLQLAIYGASDAVRSLGIPWSALLDRVPGDRVAVYASSAMGQLDMEGAGGLLASHLLGRHTTSRNCPFGLPQMPADFVNAYVIGSVGRTAGLIGACATFLYNLEKGVADIRAQAVDVALVGAAEAPVTPEVIESYRAMSALAEDMDLLELDGLDSGEPDHRRALRPFARNCGFTMGESAQYLVLMSADLALELGATIHGAVPGVFVHADGPKKSISSSGIGNYLTLGKACTLAAKILGDDGLRQHTLLHAHGTGTPQNRVTESHVFDRVAAAFDIRQWVVAATKCYVGHSLGPAAGDQTAFALGTLATGRVPGIVTSAEFASDVHQERLSLSNRHREYPIGYWQGVFINSKGFGGNNATGLVLSPEVTSSLLARAHGPAVLREHAARNEAVRAQQQLYEAALLEGHDEPIYNFGLNVVEGTDLSVERTEIRIPGYRLPVALDVDNPFGTLG
jgi:acetoacetyl-[acyl-carrier protein] synthase